MNGRTKIKNETCFVVARKEQHKCTKNYKLNSCELLWCTENIYIKKKRINMKVWKKKKIGDWVETKKADILGAQIII